MEKCVHVSKIRPAWDHSILNPVKWLCYICRTTESVWACLSCSNVACGRFNEQHALKHFQESKHPISIEVNDKYIYCYVCDDYVLNDNAAGDIKLLRSALSAIATQKFTDIESRGRRLLRSYSHSGVIKRDHADEDDKVATADWHQRQRLLGKVFGAWRTYVSNLKKSSRREKKPLVATPSVTHMKRTITPGVTGLRNLGNTCYMNSVLQVLSHIDAFRDFFLSLKNYDRSPSISPQVSSVLKSSSINQSLTQPPVQSSSSSSSSVAASASQNKLYIRQTTVECFQHLMSTRSRTKNTSPQRKLGGLNGGSMQTSTRRRQHLICEVEAKGTSDKNVSLCSELHGLFRVLWSGKWAQVSPHAFLQAVWQAIPLFKGYFQQDAQEFLCELLDKVQRELDCVPRPLRREDAQLVTELFQGELVSQVTCLSCGNLSQTCELFLDLSLEFPDRYQITKQNSRIAQDICHLTEMLAKFTDVEYLEGQIYACEKCNKKKGKHKEKIYTEARKQLLINKLPQILRLHLKRFRWSGRNHREKISTHVAVDENLNLKPFCSESSGPTCHEYQLFAVVIHHGKGFAAGHYTAFVWNHEAESWVNCNDSRMILSSIDEVLRAQAYILFYRAITDKLPLLTKMSSSLYSLSSYSSTDTVPYNNTDFLPYNSTKTLPYNSKGTLPYKLKLDTTLILDQGDSDDILTDTNRLSSSAVPNLHKQLPKKGRNNQKVKNNQKASPKLATKNTDLVDTFVKIDAEISFKNSPSMTSYPADMLTSMQDSKRHKRAGKPLLDGSTPAGKKKKMSVSTDMFYPKQERKKHQDSHTSSLHSSLEKLDKFICMPTKLPPRSPPHMKRRKSTFW